MFFRAIAVWVMLVGGLGFVVSAFNMLEKGNTRGESEGEIDTLLDVIDLFKEGALRLSAHEQLRFELELQLAP